MVVACGKMLACFHKMWRVVEQTRIVLCFFASELSVQSLITFRILLRVAKWLRMPKIYLSVAICRSVVFAAAFLYQYFTLIVSMTFSCSALRLRAYLSIAPRGTPPRTRAMELKKNL